ncbi:MAG: C40 family peptidase [candidate division Zixibacteria bacterium]|nr:C40 family peptidase [candidate division Zixibacteria bacterium]
MKTLLVISVLLMGLAGCIPAPRYGQQAKSKAQPAGRTDPNVLPSNDFLRLGTIIRQKLGTPYVGTSKYKSGTDCSNLTQEIFGEYAGISLGRSAQEQFSNGSPVARNRLEFGDLVFFSLKKNRITHVGIYVGHGDFIHASESYGVILSRLNDTYWAHSFAGARRVLVPARR